jgi:hypothetical protein
MIMVRQPGFRILPMVLPAVVALAVVGSLVHVLCEDEEAGFGEPTIATLLLLTAPRSENAGATKDLHVL